LFVFLSIFRLFSLMDPYSSKLYSFAMRPVFKFGLLLDCFNKVNPLFNFSFFLSFIFVGTFSVSGYFSFFLKSAFLNSLLSFKSLSLNFSLSGLFSPLLFLCFSVVEFMLIFPRLKEGMLLVENDFFSKLLIEWNLLNDVSLSVLLSFYLSVYIPSFPGLHREMILPTLIFFIVRSWRVSFWLIYLGYLEFFESLFDASFLEIEMELVYFFIDF